MPRKYALVFLIFFLIAVGTGIFFKIKHRIPGLDPFGVSGPEQKSVLPLERQALLKDFSGGGISRLAFVVTDEEALWLPLVQALKSFGIPLRVMNDYQQALRHKTVLLYPMPSQASLPAAIQHALARFVEEGGTLISVGVHGEGLPGIFGFRIAKTNPRHVTVRFAQEPGGYLTLADPREREISLGSPDGRTTLNPHAFLDPAGPQVSPMAHYPDGSPAILLRENGRGRAAAIGIDLGRLLHLGHAQSSIGTAREYINTYEPVMDVFLRLIGSLYQRGEKNAVLLGTVPFGRDLPVVITHDVDYRESIANSLIYATLERDLGIQATYFVQTKYIKDFHDKGFWEPKGVETIRKVAELGMEIASHSVSHSIQFDTFPLGDGTERYPTYGPFISSPEVTHGGTVFGELRISRFLIEKLVGGEVLSFRPGYLDHPQILPQALAATGYRFSSCLPANVALSYLPFQVTYGLNSRAPLPVYEFPLTIEDEKPPPMNQRIDQALIVADRLAGFGGLCLVLIHPNELGPKFEFEKKFVEALRSRAWFGTLREFGQWWETRDHLALDVEGEGNLRAVNVILPRSISGLTLIVPEGWHFQTQDPQDRQEGQRVILGPREGRSTLWFQVVAPGGGEEGKSRG